MIMVMVKSYEHDIHYAERGNLRHVCPVERVSVNLTWKPVPELLLSELISV